MIKDEELKQIIETLLLKITTKDEEIGRILVRDQFEQYDSRITIWAIRKKERDIKETTVTDLTEFPHIEVKITYAPPSFFLDVLGGQEDVPFWQVATVVRLLNHSDIIYDPKGSIQEWVDQVSNIEWKPEVIELKQKTTQILLERMKKCLNEDMLADAYIWLLKAAEEAICVPLMKNNAFNVGTATLMLEVLQTMDNNLYTYFSQLLRVSSFTPDRLKKALEELVLLADHLYTHNIKTNREMWILAAFVSINESERRLNHYLEARKNKNDSKFCQRLLESAIGELWQAFFLVAQNPRLDVKLDPPVVGSFWNWFGSSEINEQWFSDQEKRILDIIQK